MAPITVHDVRSFTNQHLTLENDHIEFVHNVEKVKSWMDKHNSNLNEPFTEDEELELASILAEEIKLKDPNKAGICSKWSLTSTIYRNEDPKTGTKTYTNAVHRDLSEDSVSNLNQHHNHAYFYNVWIPRTTVMSSPLGLITPDSVDLPKESVGFLGLENDKTGINFSNRHNWIYCSDLTVGDLILWHSEVVYHASFPIPGQTAPRNSVDFRIYFGF